jgi:hypothetical protein
LKREGGSGGILHGKIHLLLNFQFYSPLLCEFFVFF